MATIYYSGCTLDGFIATTDHDLGWLTSRDIDNTGPMNYDDFFKGVGAMAMGASTYQWLLDHAPGDWGYTIPAWVFTHRTFPATADDIRFTAAPVEQVHAEMVAAAAGRDVWLVGGGALVGEFAGAGLLDEVWLQYAPVTLGAGAPVLPRHVELSLREVARNRDFVCTKYDVVRGTIAG
jgi:dihydrofolate reductase